MRKKTACGSSAERTYSDTEKLLKLIYDFGEFESEAELVSVAYIGKHLSRGLEIDEPPIDERRVDFGIQGLREPNVLMNLLWLEACGYIANSRLKGTIRLLKEGREYVKAQLSKLQYSSLAKELELVNRRSWLALSVFIFYLDRYARDLQETKKVIERTFNIGPKELEAFSQIIRQSTYEP